MLKSNLEGRKVLLAGATSYLATRLAPAFEQAGCQVVAIVRRPEDNVRLPDAARRNPALILTSNEGELTARLRESGAAVLINCITDYGRGGRSPAAVLDANLLVPLRLLAAADAAGIQMMLSVSSALPRELNVYSLSKAQFVEQARLLARDRTRFCEARCDIFYGPNEPDAKKLPSMLFSRLAANVERVDLSPGGQQRDFLYVDDLALALVTIAQHELGFGVGFASYDIGSGRRTTLRAFAELVKGIAASETELAFGALPYRSGEVMDVAVDPTPLFSLGWTPHVSLEEGIRRAIAAEPRHRLRPRDL